MPPTVLLPLFLFGVLGGSASAERLNIGLKSAISLALESSPDFIAAKSQKRVASLSERSALMKFFPTLSLETSHGLGDDSKSSPLTSDTKPWISSYSLLLQETLYDNGKSWTEHTVAQLAVEKSDLDLKKKQSEIIVNLMRSYYRYSAAVQAHGMKKEQHELLKKQFAIIEVLYKQGLKKRSDYLNFSSELKRSELSIFDADIEIKNHQYDLLKMIGIAIDQDVVIQTLDILEYKIETPRERLNLELNPEMRSFHIKEKILSHQVQLARREFWPQVHLTGGMTYGNSSYVNSPTRSITDGEWSWSALIGVKMALWDWGTRSRAIEIEKEKEIIGSFENKKRRLELQSEAISLENGIKNLTAQKKLSLELFKVAEENLKFQQREFREGRVSSQDMITFMKTYLEAKQNVLKVNLSLIESIATFHHIEGNLYEYTMGR